MLPGPAFRIHSFVVVGKEWCAKQGKVQFDSSGGINTSG